MNNTLELAVAATSLAIQQQSVDVDKLDTAKPLAEIFAPYQTTLEKWKAKAATLVVTDLSQHAEMKMARVARLELKDARVEMEKTRKNLVQGLKERTSKIDTAARTVRENIEELEETLRASEEFAERHAAKVKAELREKRETELMTWLDAPLLVDLSNLTEQGYQEALAATKLVRQAKIDAAAKVESDRLAKEAADKAERERIVAENAKLKEIAIEMERQAAIQRQQHEAEVAEGKRIAKVEADAIAKRLAEEQRVRDVQAAKERAALKKLAEEQEAKERRIEAERKAEREKAEAERAAEKARADAEFRRLEAERAAERKKVEADRIAAESKASQERAAIEAAAAHAANRAQAETERLNAELAAKAKAEAAEKARVEAERKRVDKEARAAAAAPDNAKLKAFAMTIREMQVPQLTRMALNREITEWQDEFATWLESEINTELDLAAPEKGPK